MSVENALRYHQDPRASNLIIYTISGKFHLHSNLDMYERNAVLFATFETTKYRHSDACAEGKHVNMQEYYQQSIRNLCYEHMPSVMRFENDQQP